MGRWKDHSPYWNRDSEPRDGLYEIFDEETDNFIGGAPNYWRRKQLIAAHNTDIDQEETDDFSEKGTPVLREVIKNHREEVQELEEQITDLQNQLSSQTYKGNSISYIYDKMTAYRNKATKYKKKLDKVMSELESLNTCPDCGVEKVACVGSSIISVLLGIINEEISEMSDD